MSRAIPLAAAGILILLGAAILAYFHFYRHGITLPPQYYKSAQSAPHPSSAHFDHVIIILEENKPQEAVLGNKSAPYINQLAHKYAYATHYYAVTNPSLPNYIALTSGTTAGIHNDCNPPGGSCVANVPNIADRLEQAGKSWKEYAESMPKPCYAQNSGDYAVKHNPFMYYPDIASNATRCKAHVVPFSQLTIDLAADNLPDYAFITPNLCNDMHNCSIQTGDNWLARHLPSLLNSRAFTQQNSLIAIVWDEGDDSNNNVLAIFAGSAAKTGYVSSDYYSHYSLLHTIENNWQLDPLTSNDKIAPIMTSLLH